MKKLLLSAATFSLLAGTVAAQLEQTIYAQPLVNQAASQPQVKELYADAFKISDVNSDKFISENEFTHLVSAVDAEINLTDQEKTNKKARLLKMFTEVDANKDNKLDAGEFHNLMLAETEFEAQKRFNKMSEILNSPDPDSEIQKYMNQALEQLEKATSKLQNTSPQDMAESFIKNVSNSIADENYFQMDKDKDGCATKNEFIEYMLVYQKNQHEESPDLYKEADFINAEGLAEWFDSIDKKNDACLIKEEYVKDFTDMSLPDIDE